MSSGVFSVLLDPVSRVESWRALHQRQTGFSRSARCDNDDMDNWSWQRTWRFGCRYPPILRCHLDESTTSSMNNETTVRIFLSLEWSLCSYSALLVKPLLSEPCSAKSAQFPCYRWMHHPTTQQNLISNINLKMGILDK